MNNQAINNRIQFDINNGIADVRLIRIDKSNALDGEMFDALIACGRQLANTAGLRAVVLSGEGKGFCAGIDRDILAEMEQGTIAGESDLISRSYGLCNRFQYAAWVWRDLPVPVIAAVHGFALGGGFQLALGADTRYVSPDTKLALMEVKWGLVPDMGATHLMASLAREDVIRDLSYSGRVFDGNEALAYGFATQVCDDPYAQAMASAHDIANKNPDAIRALKRIFNNIYDTPARSRLIDEAIEQQVLVGSKNQMETILADKEKRLSVFVD